METIKEKDEGWPAMSELTEADVAELERMAGDTPRLKSCALTLRLCAAWREQRKRIADLEDMLFAAGQEDHAECVLKMQKQRKSLDDLRKRFEALQTAYKVRDHDWQKSYAEIERLNAIIASQACIE
jgi:hypothetical protein